jgi:hypothetical protein
MDIIPSTSSREWTSVSPHPEGRAGAWPTKLLARVDLGTEKADGRGSRRPTLGDLVGRKIVVIVNLSPPSSGASSRKPAPRRRDRGRQGHHSLFRPRRAGRSPGQVRPRRAAQERNPDSAAAGIAPSRRITAGSRVRSSTVEGRPPGVLPPSMMSSTRPSKRRRTSAGSASSFSPVRLALVAVTGALSSKTSRRSHGAGGMRRPTVPPVPRRAAGNPGAALRTTVSGPGQNRRRAKTRRERTGRDFADHVEVAHYDREGLGRVTLFEAIDLADAGPRQAGGPEPVKGFGRVGHDPVTAQDVGDALDNIWACQVLSQGQNLGSHGSRLHGKGERTACQTGLGGHLFRAPETRPSPKSGHLTHFRHIGPPPASLEPGVQGLACFLL